MEKTYDEGIKLALEILKAKPSIIKDCGAGGFVAKEFSDLAIKLTELLSLSENQKEK